jgi:hypothetical protein
MECDTLNNTLGSAEGALTCSFTDTVDHNLGSALYSGGHGGEVIALRVPRNFANNIFQGDCHNLLMVNSSGREAPSALLLGSSRRFNSVG